MNTLKYCVWVHHAQNSRKNGKNHGKEVLRKLSTFAIRLKEFENIVYQKKNIQKGENIFTQSLDICTASYCAPSSAPNKHYAHNINRV